MDCQFMSTNQTSNKKLVETGYCDVSVFRKVLSHSDQTDKGDLFYRVHIHTSYGNSLQSLIKG